MRFPWRRIGIRLSADGCHIPCGKFPPVGEDRRKRGSDFIRSQLEKAVARSARESILQALCKLGIKCRASFGLRLSRDDRAESGSEQGRLNPCRESTSFTDHPAMVCQLRFVS